jgi:predicted MFS family arabinose efflux permease
MASDIVAQKPAAILSTFRDSPVAVKAILLGVFINRLGGFLNIFLVLYLTTRGYPAAQAALGLGGYGAGALIGVAVGGMLAERLGPRNATVISMASTCVLTAALLYLPGYPLLLAAAVLVGLGGQLYRPAAVTLMSELTSDHSQIMIYAMHRFCLNVGAMAAPLIGYALYEADGGQFYLLFWAEGLAAACYAVLACVALPARCAAARVVGRAAAADRRRADRHVPAVLRDRRYLIYLAAMLLHTAVYAQYLSTLPLDVHAAGVSTLWYTVAVALNGFIVIACELPLTKITQRWPFTVTLGLACALEGLGVACYGLPLGPAVILGGTLAWSAGEIIGGPAIFAYPAVAAPRRHKSGYIGSFQFVFAAGGAAGPAIGGLLFSRLGHHVWPVLAVGSLIATVLVLTAVRNAARSAAPADEQGAAIAPAENVVVAESAG